MFAQSLADHSLQACRCNLRAEAEEKADQVNVELVAPNRFDRSVKRAGSVQVDMERGQQWIVRPGQPVRDGLIAGSGLLELGLGPFQVLTNLFEDREDLGTPSNGGICERVREDLVHAALRSS
ncbi:MAG: hypothetical protein QM656_00190 [Paracoccaceae bacterium]